MTAALLDTERGSHAKADISAMCLRSSKSCRTSHLCCENSSAFPLKSSQKFISLDLFLKAFNELGVACFPDCLITYISPVRFAEKSTSNGKKVVMEFLAPLGYLLCFITGVVSVLQRKHTCTHIYLPATLNKELILC